jgi:hypothetical protein
VTTKKLLFVDMIACQRSFCNDRRIAWGRSVI